MRPTITESPLLQYLVAQFIASGKVTILPAGDCIRDNDGENWQQVNRKTYLIKLDKGAG